MTPTREQLEYGRARDEAADRVEHTRRAWHDARTAEDRARHAYEAAVELRVRAALEHANAVTAYDAAR